ncbi:coiled-coil domain-containing protein 24 isoform X1 [Carcharodon carcharias]|uniref:coiled-coil domain-containing protein 24 isoform X1 n=1 Tax=Carcharodon carcharias TaxID=13397 RepID=UPI001B7F105A|nr:coiled-coil domain-containing protein 24 isoform X1 [Carcharodon carcharias]XP_041064850.1 coiled-coil domain-containing protein 24 isoform X1 [Carcharodon carcharias]XP_041064851.1 coiled-coil domain-containing protein 24 isoform X1 [Carcharodon carcharias]XP_041064852.1 coiled-coil domain-containing protein 24 isoform X1 [Carcharodon carcharias]XP_041064853.1 coiled-coil domain-containing protein 24 isoform X1 [Carcharodon carcharias]XP_041064854.1 coiled-coil domain-containing protein 24
MNLNCEEGDNIFPDNYEQPSSLWKLIEECVPSSETNEIREILGTTAVDFSLDLHAEVAALSEIWRLMRATRLTVFRSQVSHAVLPEAPAIKGLLRQEIQFLLLNIQKKAHKEGRDENDVLSSYNPDIVRFAMEQSKAVSILRPASTESLIDKWMGLGCSQTSNNSESESLSALSNCKDNIEAIKDKINVRNIDEVVAHLQFILQEESNTLEKHVQFLQECIEEEHKYSLNLTTQNAVPSIAELKDERKILERDLQMTPSIRSMVQVHKPPGCRSSKRSSRNASRRNHTAASPLEGIHYSALTVDLSETNLEQKMKKHSISPVDGSNANGTRDSSIKLGYSEALALSPHRTSLRAVDLLGPTYHEKGASARCPAPESPCTPGPPSKVKSKSKVQLHLTDDMSRTFSIQKIESTHDRTCIAGSLSLQEEEVQKSLAYSGSTNNFPVGQQSVSSSIWTDAHCITESKRTLSSNLRSPVEVLSSVSKQDGHILIPSPPSAEKPIGAQPRSTHRVRRARVDSVAGSA